MRQKPFHVSGTKDLLLKSSVHGLQQNLRPVLLEKVVEPIYFADPPFGPAMDDLGQGGGERGDS